MADLTDTQRAELKNKVCDVLEIDPAEVNDDARFEDLGADSMLALEILALLDREYGLNLDNSVLADMETMNGIYSIVERHN